MFFLVGTLLALFLKFVSDTSDIYKCLLLQVKAGTPVESWPLLLLRQKASA